MEKQFALFLADGEVPLLMFNCWHNLRKGICSGLVLLLSKDTRARGRFLKMKNSARTSLLSL